MVGNTLRSVAYYMEWRSAILIGATFPDLDHLTSSGRGLAHEAWFVGVVTVCFLVVTLVGRLLQIGVLSDGKG